MGKVRYIVWHTAAHGVGGKDHDTNIDQVRSWHKDRGWKDVGYHFLVRKDGTIQRGRKLDDDNVLESDEIGTHVYGINSESVGICFSGHGDISPHTVAQRIAGLELTRRLMQQFGVSVENVIGHREINRLVAEGLYPANYRTSKTCPGKLVDMEQVRRELVGAKQITINKESAKELFDAFRAIYKVSKELNFSDETVSTINDLRKNPEIDKVIEFHKKTGG